MTTVRNQSLSIYVDISQRTTCVWTLTNFDERSILCDWATNRYSLKPASLFSSPATRITTNFLKSLVEVGLLWPEFQPQAARDQDILSSPRVSDVISKFHDVQSRDFTICACMPVYEQNVSETRLLMNWWRAIGDVSGQITVRGRCKMKHMYTLYVWKVHNARETCIVVGNRSCEP